MPVPDAWDDDWEVAADTTPSEPTKKITSKVSKAQRRAEQAEFNRQIWEQADGPREPNYFLETRDIVPKADLKPPPTLLTRKSPGVSNGADSSEDENGNKKKTSLTVEEQRALATKEREEKQRKYEERRLEIFGSTNNTSASAATASKKPGSTSGRSSPAETPPGSRSATPNRPRGGRGGGGGVGGGRMIDSSRPLSLTSSLSLKPSSIAPAPVRRELFDPNATLPRPESASRRLESRENVLEPIRMPRGPDSSGRGGFGFGPRAATETSTAHSGT